MRDDRLFLVRDWVNGQVPRAAVRDVESEDTAVIDDPIALGRRLLGQVAPKVDPLVMQPGAGGAQ